MKNRHVVILAGLFLGMLTGCGSADIEPRMPEPVATEAEARAMNCPVCPLAPGEPAAQSAVTPVKDEVTGMYSCPPPCGGYCGDGYCDGSGKENGSTCPSDCGGGPATFVCGDSICDNGESPYSCPSDCAYCGDGACTNGENADNCPSDCGGGFEYCGNGRCAWSERSWCFEDCG